MAKYRRKATSNTSGDTSKVIKSGSAEQPINSSFVGDDERLVIEPGRVEVSYAFADAKKKLRLVLSTAEMQQVPDGLPAMVFLIIKPFFFLLFNNCKFMYNFGHSNFICYYSKF